MWLITTKQNCYTGDELV
uniref:Uncharacterized protein n=1 Tax=Wuchereria bancrofti TaxID=6293 RepID=A0A1I8EII2_WUCBA